jgi:hypothetical protein
VTVDSVVPDPHDAVCGYCGREVALKRIGPVHEIRWRRVGSDVDEGTLGVTYVCPRRECNRPSLVFFTVRASRGYRELDAAIGQLPAGTAKTLDGPDRG